MKRLLYHIARLFLKHYPDKKYLDSRLYEQEQRLKADIKELLSNVSTPTTYGNHYLMQYAQSGSEERLWHLLLKMEKYRLKDSFKDMSHYTFDLDSYYKTDIYDLWKEILNPHCR